MHIKAWWICHSFVHNTSKCISPMKLFYFASNLFYQHPICGSEYWPGAEQASCHYIKQRWPFWRIHTCVIWPQWINELSGLSKTEYRWRGNMHVINWEKSIHTSWRWQTWQIHIMGVDTDENLIWNGIYRFWQIIPKPFLVRLIRTLFVLISSLLWVLKSWGGPCVCKFKEAN